MMITPTGLETMALYHKWQNETLFQICAALGQDQVFLDQGMFLGSIFKPLNPIIHVDEMSHSFIYTKILPQFNPN